MPTAVERLQEVYWKVHQSGVSPHLPQCLSQLPLQDVCALWGFGGTPLSKSQCGKEIG